MVIDKHDLGLDPVWHNIVRCLKAVTMHVRKATMKLTRWGFYHIKVITNDDNHNIMIVSFMRLIASDLIEPTNYLVIWFNQFVFSLITDQIFKPG